MLFRELSVFWKKYLVLTTTLVFGNWIPQDLVRDLGGPRFQACVMLNPQVRFLILALHVKSYVAV